MAVPQGMIRGVIIKLPHTRDVSGKSSIGQFVANIIRCPTASIHAGMKLENWDAATCCILAQVLVYIKHSSHRIDSVHTVQDRPFWL